MLIPSINTNHAVEVSKNQQEEIVIVAQCYTPSPSSKTSWRKFQAEHSRLAIPSIPSIPSIDDSEENFIEQAEMLALMYAGKAFGKWEKGDLPGAIRSLSQAIRHVEKEVPSSVILVNLYHARACIFVESGKIDHAIEDLSSALTNSHTLIYEHSEHSPSHLQRERALAFFFKGDFSQATKDLQEASEQGDTIAALLLEASEATSTHIAPIPYPQDEELLQYAEKLFSQKRYTLAIEACSKYIEERKDADSYILNGAPYTRMLAIRGASYALLGKEAEGIDDFNEAITRESDGYDLLNYLNGRALVHLMHGDKKAAIKDLKTAREETLIDCTAHLILQLP